MVVLVVEFVGCDVADVTPVEGGDDEMEVVFLCEFFPGCIENARQFSTGGDHQQVAKLSDIEVWIGVSKEVIEQPRANPQLI